MNEFCLCGCGQKITTKTFRFVRGHKKRNLKKCLCGCGQTVKSNGNYIYKHDDSKVIPHRSFLADTLHIISFIFCPYKYIRNCCVCGCGQITNKGKDFIIGHNSKIFTKHPNYKSERHIKQSCLCGCGNLASEGKKYIQWHHNRVYHPMQGKHHSLTSRQKTSKAMEGKPLSKLHKRKIGEKSKLNWQNEEYAKNICSKCGRKPNHLELNLNTLLQYHFSNEFKYVGDWRVWIAGKNPDFLNVNGKKQVIQLHGIYWHLKKQNLSDCPRNRKLIEKQEQAHFSKYGLSCLVIWEDELKNQEMLTDKIKTFVEGK